MHDLPCEELRQQRLPLVALSVVRDIVREALRSTGGNPGSGRTAPARAGSRSSSSGSRARGTARSASCAGSSCRRSTRRTASSVAGTRRASRSLSFARRASTSCCIDSGSFADSAASQRSAALTSARGSLFVFTESEHRLVRRKMAVAIFRRSRAAEAPGLRVGRAMARMNRRQGPPWRPGNSPPIPAVAARAARWAMIAQRSGTGNRRHRKLAHIVHGTAPWCTELEWLRCAPSLGLHPAPRANLEAGPRIYLCSTACPVKVTKTVRK